MWGNEKQPARPTAGCLSVPLFNQRKRPRLPLTSIPTVNDSVTINEYMSNPSSASTPPHSTSGTSGSYQVSSYPIASAAQSNQWNQQSNPQSYQHPQHGSKNLAPRPVSTTGTLAPKPHPYKAANTSAQTRQPNHPAGAQNSGAIVHPGQNAYQVSYNSGGLESKSTFHNGFSQMGQKSAYKMPPMPYHSQQPSRPPPPTTPHTPNIPAVPGPMPQSTWRFKAISAPGPQRSLVDKERCTQRPELQTQKTPMQPPTDKSLRILTAVIDGMRHWSQFKDRAPILFEIFGTLDSAVTFGSHGSKKFLMRDGKDAVQCVFYENELTLPRLIRGQLHRCVGNYDSTRDILNCVSVRPGQLTEQRNAQVVVKECDLEMRELVKSFNET